MEGVGGERREREESLMVIGRDVRVGSVCTGERVHVHCWVCLLGYRSFVCPHVERLSACVYI